MFFPTVLMQMNKMNFSLVQVLFQNDSPATLLARVIGIIAPIDQSMLAKGRDTYKYFTKNHMLYERNQVKVVFLGYSFVQFLEIEYLLLTKKRKKEKKIEYSAFSNAVDASYACRSIQWRGTKIWSLTKKPLTKMDCNMQATKKHVCGCTQDHMQSPSLLSFPSPGQLGKSRKCLHICACVFMSVKLSIIPKY